MKKTSRRLINGLLLVDKPNGPSSNAVLQRVKRLFNAQKAGHTGSLDPMATGMLPVCFGEATKFSQYLLEADKCYEVTAQFGIKTDTGDATGERIHCVEDASVSEEALHLVLKQFLGPITQVPSMFSALKHQGQPLYKLARKGIEVERKPRAIVIHDIEVNEFRDGEVDLVVTCSKGTYIRNLVEDIGDALGVGAHVTRLHRSYTMGLKDMPMYSLDELTPQSLDPLLSILLPVDRAVQQFPKLSLTEVDVRSIRQGKTLKQVDVDGAGGCFVRLYDQALLFIGLGEISSLGDLKAKRLLA